MSKKNKLGSLVSFESVIVAGKVMIPAGEGIIVQQHELQTKLGESPEIVDIIHTKSGDNVEIFDRSVSLIKQGNDGTFRTIFKSK